MTTDQSAFSILSTELDRIQQSSILRDCWKLARDWPVVTLAILSHEKTRATKLREKNAGVTSVLGWSRHWCWLTCSWSIISYKHSPVCIFVTAGALIYCTHNARTKTRFTKYLRRLRFHQVFLVNRCVCVCVVIMSVYACRPSCLK